MTNDERKNITSANPEQADIDRAAKEGGNKIATDDDEKPGEIAAIDPRLSEDDLKPDTGADEAGPEKADVERAKRENRKAQQ